MEEAFNRSYWSKFLIDNGSTTKERDSSNIVQCVSGFLSLYFGQDFAILFLNEIGITKLGVEGANALPKDQIFYK